MEVWTKKEIQPDHLYWPVFGSFNDWICQALKLYVNGKKPFNQEESDYAALWKESPITVSLFPLKEKKGKVNKPNKQSWEPLDNLPPPIKGKTRELVETASVLRCHPTLFQQLPLPPPLQSHQKQDKDTGR